MLAPPPLRITGSAAAGALFAQLASEPNEVIAIAYLTEDRRVLGLRHTRSESRDRMALPIRAIAADAIAFDARGVVLAHNHPSGDPTPSAADRDATRQLLRALAALEVRLVDHLVIASTGNSSFRALGFL